MVNICFIAFNNDFNSIFTEQNSVAQEDIENFYKTSESEEVYYSWNKTWGGIYGDFGEDIVIDQDNNTYLVGSTSSYGAGNDDLVVVKFTSNGTRKWNSTWGGPDDDYGYGICVDTAGYIYAIGKTWSFGAGNYDFAVIKFHPNGSIVWNLTWGGTDLDDGYGIAVDQTGYIYTAGRSKSFDAAYYDLVVVKFHQNGTRLWNRTWGEPQMDKGERIILDQTGKIYVVGYTENPAPYDNDLVVIKFDPNGTKIWNNTWGGSDNDVGYDIELDSAGNIYTVGYTGSYGNGNDDFMVIKFHPNGTIAWNNTWGSSGYECGEEIALDPKGNIYTVGYVMDSIGGNSDIAVVKFYPNGSLVWDGTWDNSDQDIGRGIALGLSGTIFTTGYTKIDGFQDLLLVKFYQNSPPYSNHPEDLIINQYSSENISWVILDNIGGGDYRVIINGIPDYWHSWMNNSIIDYPINTSISGVFNYTIQFCDSTGLWGDPDTVIVSIDGIPQSNQPQNITIIIDQYPAGLIQWILFDDYGSGYYRFLINDTPTIWMQWENNSYLNCSFNTSIASITNYTIQFNDSAGNWGTDTVFVTILSDQITTTPPIPSFLMIFVFIGQLIALSISRKSNRNKEIY